MIADVILMKNNLKLVLFCHIRSGSASLYEILQMHPMLNIIDEPFNDEFNKRHPEEKNYVDAIDDIPSLEEALADIFSRYNGLKVQQWQLRRELYSHMLRKPEYTIIFLRRQNLLQTSISGMIAHQTTFWQKRDLTRSLDEIYAHLQPISIDEIRKWIQGLSENIAYYDRVISSRPAGTYLKLVYEDLYLVSPRQRRVNFEAIFRFLDLDMSEIEDNALQKYLNPENAQLNSSETYRFIPNVDEIEETLGSDETGWLFPDKED